MKKRLNLLGSLIALGSVSAYIAKKDGIKELLVCVIFAIIAIALCELTDRVFKRQR